MERGKQIPDELYAARQGVIQMVGVDELERMTDEFRPILRELCSTGNFSTAEGIDYLLQNIDNYDIDPPLLMAICAEIIEPRLE